MRLTLVLLACILVPLVTGKEKLPLLTMLPFDIGRGFHYSGCQAAVEIVIEHVNNRSDILHDYEIELVFKDEGRKAELANKAMVDFNRRNEQNLTAPLIFGPVYDCHSSAATAKEMGFVMMSPGCTGQNIIERKKRYRLVSSQAPSKNLIWAAMAFITQIGQWKEIAVVTHRLSPDEYLLGELMAQIATKNGVKVLHFSNDYEITMETIEAVKTSKAVAIVVAIYQPNVCVRLMCLAHQTGMLAPRHVFLLPQNCLFENTSSIEQFLPGNCTISMVEEFMKTAFGFGAFEKPLETDSISHLSSLGYSANDFEQQYQIKTSGIAQLDQNFRYFCHDAMMMLILALDATVGNLRLEFNNSLAMFKNKPHLVQKMVFDSIHNQSFNTLRIGNVRYGNDGEIFENYVITQMDDQGKRQPVAYTKYHTDHLQIENMDVEEIDKIQWQTETGDPPRDFSSIQNLRLVFSIEFLATFSSLLIVASVIHIGSAVIFNRDFLLTRELIKYCLTIGCVFYNLTGVFILVFHRFFPDIECSVRRFAFFFSLSFIDGCLLAISVHCNELAVQIQKQSEKKSRRMRRMRPKISSKQAMTKKIIRNNWYHGSVQRFILQLYGFSTQSEWLTGVIFGIIFIFISFFTLSLWITQDSMVLTYFESEIKFDNLTGNYFYQSWTKCVSQNNFMWGMVTLVFQIVSLVSAACFAYRSSKVRRIPHELRSLANRIFFAVTNSLMLLLACCVASVIISCYNCEERLELASVVFFILLSSTSVHFTVFPPKHRLLKVRSSTQ